MVKIKTYRVKGEMKKGFRTLTFSKEVRSSDEKKALEKVYDEIASRNRLKRKQIKIHIVEEINPREAKDPFIRMVAGEKI